MSKARPESIDMANLAIFQGLLQPPKSVADYDQQAAELQRAKLQNQTLGYQNQAAERGAQRADQLLQLSRSLPQGTTDLDRLAALRGAGFYDEADKLDTSLQNRVKTQAQAAKDTAEAGSTSFKTQEARKTARLQAISQFTNPQDALNHIADGVAKGDISQEDAVMMAKNVPSDPAEFQKWQLLTIQALLTPEQQTKLTTPDANSRLSSQTLLTTNALTNATTRRGQNMVDARTRESTSAAVSKPFEVTGPDGSPVLVQQTQDGTITPVKGYTPKTGKQKDIPASVNTKIIEGAQGISNIDSAIQAIRDYPDALGFTNAVPGMQNIRQVTDPKGVAVRAQVANIGSLTLHDRSGAAVSASEFPRLAPFIPSASDSPAAAIAKLQKMKKIASEELGLYADTYGPDNGYKASPVLKRNAPVATPATTAAAPSGFKIISAK